MAYGDSSNSDSHPTFPIGIVADGNNYANNGMTTYEVNTGGISGGLQLNSVSTNPSKSGTSLQLNAVLHVITTNGTVDYWTQNVLQIYNTDYKSAGFLDNIWKFTDSNEPLVECIKIPFLNHAMCKKEQFYYRDTSPFVYQLPFSTTLVMTEEVIPTKGVQVKFMHMEHGNTKIYDQRMLTIPNIISASFLITTKETLSNYLPYDAEFVWGGKSNGEMANFTSMNSILNLQYQDINSNTWKPFPSYSSHGFDTAETAQNIYSTIKTDFPGFASVGFGNDPIQNGPSSSTTTINEPQTNPPVTDTSNSGYAVGYSITNGKVLGMKTDVRDSSLIVSVNSVNKGTITLQLPRPVIDAKTNSGQDEAFVIIVNGALVQPESESANNYLRNITIPFSQGDVNIEIVGTHAASGFGAFASGIVGIQTIPGYVDFMPDPNNLSSSTMNEPQTNQPIIHTSSDSQFGNAMKVDGTNLSVKYGIINGQVLDIKTDTQRLSIIVSVNSINDGTITLQLPRSLIDSKTNSGQDDAFIILIDGAEVKSQSVFTDNNFRNITIPFLQGDRNIEIIGTRIVPEFGTFASIVFLIGIITTMVVSARVRRFSKINYFLNLDKCR